MGAMTLAWTHSVEKTLWEEDWRSGQYGLELAQTRVRGCGAGMEPAPDARLVDGSLDMESGPAAAEGSRAAPFGRDRRLAGLHRGPMPPDGRIWCPAGADPVT